MRRRRHRTPGTQLARAGERTRLLIGDSPLSEVRFKASTLTGTPSGRLDIETVNGTRSEGLTTENELDITGLISLSVVPEADTAITFLPPKRPANPVLAITGGAMLLGAVAWTALDLMGG